MINFIKKYELSIVKDYVSDWGLTEAIRELVQNAYDNDNKHDIEIDKDNNNITITSFNTQISQSTLTLGSSSKRDNNGKVGCYGEGYKLAILVLLRNGYDVTINNGTKIWIPVFSYSESFETEILTIEEYNGDINNHNLEFQINGIDECDLDELEKEFLGLTNEDYKSISTYYGEIILDKKYKGKMFVNGLPIADDDNFEYGYNFKPQFVNLDRDRKSINIYQLKSLTSKAIAELKEDNFDILDKLLDKGNLDAEYIKDGNTYIDNEEDYAKHLMERFDIKPNTVVCTDSNNELFETLEKQVKLGQDINYEIKTVPKKVYSDIINNYHEFSSNVIDDTKRKIDELSEKEQAMMEYDCSDYKLFKEWLEQYKNNLSNEAIDEFNKLLYNIEPDGFDLIKDKVNG